MRWRFSDSVVPGATVALFSATLLGACQAEPPTARPPFSVSAEAATLAPFTDNVDTVSTLDAVDEVQLAAQAGGRIQRLLVRQGDKVAAGQLLLVLDQAQAQADVARLEAEVQTNKLNYERY